MKKIYEFLLTKLSHIKHADDIIIHNPLFLSVDVYGKNNKTESYDKMYNNII